MKKQLIFVLMICVIVMTACSQERGREQISEDERGAAALPAAAPRAAIDARPFLSEEELRRSLSEGSGNTGQESLLDAEQEPVKALVVPHHTVAASLTAECVSRLTTQQPPAIIILAPNHYNVGSAAIGSASDFQCYGRKISTDAGALMRLADAGLISVNAQPFAREHSVGMLLPIIAWYLPDTKVIPIIFHHRYDSDQIAGIIRALKPEIDEGAVIIASIDFSHYLPMEEAEEKDQEMREYLMKGDLTTISKLDSSYIDSPTIMAALLSCFGTENMRIIANTNSGRIMRNPVSPCTSYFTIQF